MDRSDDHFSWSHGVSNYYSNNVINEHRSSFSMPGTSLGKSHNQYQNYSTLRCPEPRRPYEHMSYPPLNHFQYENIEGYFTAENNTEIPVSNCYSSHRISDFANCNDRTAYQSTCNYNNHCVEACPNLDVRQFWSTWQDKDDDVTDNPTTNNQQMYHVQEPFLLDCTRRNTYKENVTGISRSLEDNYNGHMDFSSTQLHNITDENIYKSHTSSDGYRVLVDHTTESGVYFAFQARETSNKVDYNDCPLTNFSKPFEENYSNVHNSNLGSTQFNNVRNQNVPKSHMSSDGYRVLVDHTTESGVYFAFQARESNKINSNHHPLAQQKHVRYAPYFNERSPYTLTSSLESVDHFDDINTRNEEPRRTRIHPLIHDRRTAVYHNENMDYNLQNQWTKIMYNNIQSEKFAVPKKNSWKSTQPETITNADSKIDESKYHSEHSVLGIDNFSKQSSTESITSIKSKTKSYTPFLNKHFISQNSIPVSSSVVHNTEKCKSNNEEVSSDDIYISISSSVDLGNEHRNFGTITGKNVSKEIKPNSLYTSSNTKEKNLNQNNFSNLPCNNIVNSEFSEPELNKNEINLHEECTAYNDICNLEVNTMDDCKDRNDSLGLNKVMCDVQTQVRLSYFKRKAPHCYTTDDSSKTINVFIEKDTTCHEDDNDLTHKVIPEILKESPENSKCDNPKGNKLRRLEECNTTSLQVKLKMRNSLFKSNSKNKRKDPEKLTHVSKKENDLTKELTDLKNVAYAVPKLVNNCPITSADTQAEDMSDSESHLVPVLDYGTSKLKNNEQIDAILKENYRKKPKLVLESINKITYQKEKANSSELNDNLLLLAHCSQKYHQIQIENLSDSDTNSTILNTTVESNVNRIGTARGIKCSLRWDKIFSNMSKHFNESKDESIDLGPAKVELRMPTNINANSQWKIAAGDENNSVTSSIVHVKRLILKRKSHCKEKIPKMIIKRNDDKEYISYVKKEASSAEK